MIIIKTILTIIFMYLSFWSLYIFAFSVAGKFGRKGRSKAKIKGFKKFAVLVPAYKEDAVILNTAEEALNQDYPRDMFDVVVIADSLQQQTIHKLIETGVKVVEVSFDKSTKSKSLNKALEVLPDDYDVAVILDADNIMAVDFLQEINAQIDAGYRAVQGHRVAKNLDTPLAFLDAVSEEINNHIFRRGHSALGLSGALIGSAMAFEYKLFKEIMGSIEAVGGFDREMELKLIGENIKIAYAPEAYVYDEKVSNAEVFKNQRKRWLSAQFHYFRKYFGSGVAKLFAGDVDYFNKTLQGIQAPRILLLGLLSFFAVLSAFIPVFPGWHFWVGSLGLTVFAMMLAIPASLIRKELLMAVLYLPKAFLNMFLLLFKLKGANKTFIHTPHSQVNVKR